VHLDRKSDRAEYARELDGAGSMFLDDPYEVFWGGFSMVRAELRLLQAARAAGPYDKYLLLSDDSFPVLPPRELASHFDNSMDQITLVRQDVGSPFHRRYREFVCYDHPSTAVRHPGPRTALVDEDLERRVAEIAVLRRIGKKNLEVYFGSQFWALTAESVELVLHTVEHDLQLVKSFEYAALSDELMIQSILGHYKYGRDRHSGPVYADFSIEGGPRVISTLGGLPLDLQPSHTFVRKISPVALELLEQMSGRLRAGLTIHGLSAQEPRAGGTRGVLNGDHLSLRLAAPGPDSAAGPAWHGIESFGGRTYRWTARDEVVWALPELSELRELGGKLTTIRFCITPVINSRGEFRKGCQLAFGGQRQPLELRDGSLTAEFTYSGTAEPRVVLTTPGLRSPFEVAGAPDHRKLGLSIAT